MDKSENLDAVRFEAVRNYEAGAIQERRAKFGIKDKRGAGHLGIAHSGGGIRSATFSLGILQYLAESKLLKHIDYISTVSGGGYIGSWLYSWIQREQKGGSTKDAFKAFQKVCGELNPDTGKPRPASDPEPREIAFLRQYSNYLTPRVSVFSADTWLVAATWARNTLLNVAILIAAFGSIVMLARLLGLGIGALMSRDAPAVFTQNDKYGFIAGALCALLLAPMLYIMGSNLNRISTIALSPSPPPDRKGEISDTGVILWCLSPLVAAIAYSFWMSTIRGVFIDNGLIQGILANWIILFFPYLYLQRRSLVYKCHTQKLADIDVTPPVLFRLGNMAMELIGPAAAAFVTACLLRAVALIVYPSNYIMSAFPENPSVNHPGHPWVMLTWGPPLVLIAFAVGVVVHIGLMGRDLPEAAREWFSRLRGWLLIYTSVWILLLALAIYGPWLVASLGAWSKTALATIGGGWIVTSIGGLLAGKSGTTSGKSDTESGKRPRRSALAEVAAHAAPYLFILGFALSVSFGIHAILVHETDATPRFPGPSPSATQNYNVEVRNGNVQLSPKTEKFEDTGFQWILKRYWTSLNRTELLVSDSNKRWVFSGLLVLFATFFSVGLLLSLRVDVNAFSMHNFYKNRLVRCYLGASRQRQRKPNPFTGFDDFDDIPLEYYTPDDGYYGPYPIVNAALNVTTGGKLQYQERQAQSFVFTPKYTGFSAETVVDEMRLGDSSTHASSLKQYATTQQNAESPPQRVLPTPAGETPQQGAAGYRLTRYAGGRVSVGMAVAISGAAVNPNMGYHTSTAVSFLLTLFNVRLGWWFANPLKPSFRDLGPLLGFLYMFRELFGFANADSRFVNLSDGGHFENMGIYELVRRGCRYIICCDGEQDPGPSFGGIGSAIRKCRTDFGVEIDLPLAPLRKVNGYSRAHCVVGRIRYDPNGPEADHGYIVYLKTSLTGDEPSDVLEYHARAPEFPQETTGDQWFDESQFESYRRLGYHVAQKAFSGGRVDLMDDGDRDLYFRNIYHIWYPPSPAVQTYSPAHTDLYARVLESVREDHSLDDLDANLFPGFSLTAAEPAWERNKALVCTSLIQLMERVFYDLNLEDSEARIHPYVDGWLRIFKHWANSAAFTAAWARTRESYPDRFRAFYESLVDAG